VNTISRRKRKISSSMDTVTLKKRSQLSHAQAKNRLQAARARRSGGCWPMPGRADTKKPPGLSQAALRS
jgi:hypothetical protein